MIPHDELEKEQASAGPPALPETLTITLSLGKGTCPSNRISSGTGGWSPPSLPQEAEKRARVWYRHRRMLDMHMRVHTHTGEQLALRTKQGRSHRAGVLEGLRW